MFGVDGDSFDIVDPVPYEGEEGSSSFSHSAFPVVVFEQFAEFGLCFQVLFVGFKYLIEIVLPVEHY
jgi:hypothetical protein